MDHLIPLIIGAIIVGLSKGGLASMAAIAVPALALIMNPVEAAAILLPVFIATDWVAVYRYRHEFSARNLKILIPGILAGTATATFITPYVSEGALLMFTGAIGLWYVVKTWFFTGEHAKTEAKVGPGLVWGWLTGLASFVTHSGAPPSQAYLLPQKLGRLELSGTIAIAFACGNLSKLPGYYVLGQFDDINWTETAILIAFGAAGTFGGRWLVERLDDKSFTRIIEVLLLVLSLILLAKGALELIG